MQTNFLSTFLLLLFALVPFGVERQIHGAWITSSDLLIIIACGWWCIKEKLRFRGNTFPLLALVALLLFTFLLSGINAIDKVVYLREIIKYVFLFGLFYATVNNCDNDYFLNNVPLLIFLSSLALCLWYSYDFIATGGVMAVNKMWVRKYLNAQHLNLVGTFLSLTIPFGLYYVFLANRVVYRIFALLAVLAQVVALFFTYSRGSWIAAVISILFVLIYRYRTKIHSLIIILFLLVIPFVAVSHFMPKLFLQQRLASTFNSQDASILARKEHIRAAVTLIKEHPFLGIGLKNFQITCDKELHVYVAGIVHNMFLQCAVDAGIPSMVIMVLLLSVYFRDSFGVIKSLSDDNKYKWLLVCVSASFAGLIISCQFEDPFVRYLKEYFVLLLALPYGVEKLIRRNTI